MWSCLSASKTKTKNFLEGLFKKSLSKSLNLKLRFAYVLLAWESTRRVRILYEVFSPLVFYARMLASYNCLKNRSGSDCLLHAELRFARLSRELEYSKNVNLIWSFLSTLNLKLFESYSSLKNYQWRRKAQNKVRFTLKVNLIKKKSELRLLHFYLLVKHTRKRECSKSKSLRWKLIHTLLFLWKRLRVKPERNIRVRVKMLDIEHMRTK